MTVHTPEIGGGRSDRVERLRRLLADTNPRPQKGRIVKAVGVTVHAALRHARLGEICELKDPRSGEVLLAEVVGLIDDDVVLTPIGEITGLSTRTEVEGTGRMLRQPVGPGLLGRVLDSLGRPLDGAERGELAATSFYPIHAEAPPPLGRPLITRPLPLGIRAIDALLTCGEGQRVGIYGSPGTGKSSLLADIVRGAEADVVVVGLIGERGREVREFVDRHLGPEARKRAVIVTATSDRPAI
ncbi:MAG TPA: EscN/YscN/HrcN family type III secretion system ATPase, partial [Alphaproteobacteria bacterium]|nr:EscN/YscN/HrcN family type III secretion system ATPase [Alphaproteobacteria bacterium]